MATRGGTCAFETQGESSQPNMENFRGSPSRKVEFMSEVFVKSLVAENTQLKAEVEELRGRLVKLEKKLETASWRRILDVLHRHRDAFFFAIPA